MRFNKTISTFLAGFMVIAQFGWVASAAADDNTPTPTATPVASSTPDPSPMPTATPGPSASPTTSPEPSASPAPTASPAPSSSPEPTPAPKKKSTDVGPDGCGGVIPSWVFDTASQTWVAADKSSFECDKATGFYLSPLYYFDKRIGWYEIIPPSVAVANPSYLISAPNVVHTVLGDLVIGSPDYQIAKSMGLLTGGAGGILVPSASIGGTGAGSNNQIATNTGTQTWFDLTNLVNVVNMIQSNANTGNVDSASNTAVGNASTGAAMVVANLINLLASAWSWSNGNLNFFMQTICGFNQTCQGDINLNPTQTSNTGGGQIGGNQVAIDGTGSGSNNTVDANNPNSLNVNVKNTGDITNNVNVNAQSGDANGSKNTVLGNVSTGNAMAEVNIINLINSFISSGSSFFGILNILGNFNGDILFPDGFLNGLVSPSSGPTGSTGATIGGTGADSNNQIGLSNGGSATVNTTSNNAVNNNILTTADSGAANLDANSSVGNVQTGAASTTQNLFNLANSTIFGDNAVLVMVNVLGHWVGKIMSLPGTGGTETALLTGGATVGVNNTGSGSNNTVGINRNNDATINQTSNGSITNNVKVNAQSGDANLSKNTQVGDVSTGKAEANSTAANLFNTVLNVKHWFGVLIINVVGEWTGALNEDTAAGGFSKAGKGAVAGSAAPSTTAQPSGNIPSVGLLTLVRPLVAGSSSSSTGSSEPKLSNVQGTKVLTAAAQSAPSNATAGVKARNVSFLFVLSAIVLLVAGALASIDRKLKRH